MNSLIVAALLVNAAVLGFFYWRQRRLSRMLADLQSSVAQVRNQPQDQVADLDSILGKGSRSVLVIDVLNPLEVAAQESWFADQFGSLAPSLIKKLVFQQTQGIMQEELKKYGVEAQVSVHRAD